MTDIRLEITTQETRKTSHIIRISEDFFSLQVEDTPLDFLTAIIAKQDQNIIEKLKVISENGFITPVGIAFPGAIRMVGIENHMEVNHDLLIEMDFSKRSLRIGEAVHHIWDIKTCPSRLNCRTSPSNNHILHEPYQRENELELRKEALGFVIGICDALEDDLTLLTPTLLTGLGTFAAAHKQFTNDDRQFGNYVSVWETRITRMLEVLMQNGAIIGDRGLFPKSYQKGPVLPYFRTMSRECDILLGQRMGKIAVNFSDHDIMHACLAMAPEYKLRLDVDFAFKEHTDRPLTAHQQMTALAVKTELQRAVSGQEAA